MTTLALDFAVAQRSLNRPKGTLAYGVLAIGILAFGLAAWTCDRQIDANNAVRADHDRLSARLRRAQPREQIPAELAAQFEQAASVYAEVRTPWDRLFKVLEKSRNSDIALLSMTADTGKKQLALSGEAKDFGSLSKFSDDLSANGAFASVSLSNHKLSEGAPPVVVRFELKLVWREDEEAGR